MSNGKNGTARDPRVEAAVNGLKIKTVVPKKGDMAGKTVYLAFVGMLPKDGTGLSVWWNIPRDERPKYAWVGRLMGRYGYQMSVIGKNPDELKENYRKLVSVLRNAPKERPEGTPDIAAPDMAALLS